MLSSQGSGTFHNGASPHLTMAAPLRSLAIGRERAGARIGRRSSRSPPFPEHALYMFLHTSRACDVVCAVCSSTSNAFKEVVLDLCGARARGCQCALAGERAVQRGARAHQGRGHRRERGGRAKVRKGSARPKEGERRGLFEDRREARPPDAVDPARGMREMAGATGRVALSERQRT